MMNLLTQALGVHEQALQVKSRRLEVLSQNIANADTPHYKARDIDFKAACTMRTVARRGLSPDFIDSFIMVVKRSRRDMILNSFARALGLALLNV